MVDLGNQIPLVIVHCVVYFALFDLLFGPIWETGLWVPYPATTTIGVVAFRWDWWTFVLQLLFVDIC